MGAEQVGKRYVGSIEQLARDATPIARFQGEHIGRWFMRRTRGCVLIRTGNGYVVVRYRC